MLNSLNCVAVARGWRKLFNQLVGSSSRPVHQYPDGRTPEHHAVSGVQRFDHVGITVTDLDAVTAFFVGFGFER